MSFSHYKATISLKKLAENPIDLTNAENFTEARIKRYIAKNLGFKFFYATERVTDEVLSKLNQLADESSALKKMQEMQNGEKINTIHGYDSENRAVLHTATRDFFENQNGSTAAKEATQLAKKELDKLKVFIEKIDQENQFDRLIMVGIGGSFLGPAAHYYALEHLKKKGRKVIFIANIDPDDLFLKIKEIDLKKSLVVVVSKTGKTLETATNEALLRMQFINLGLNPAKQFISVTMMGSPMDDAKKYLERFYLFDFIGGRFSTTSMVGGVVLSFAFGFDVFWELLKGANAMDKVALDSDLDNNIPLLGALIGIWNRNFLKLKTLAIIPYAEPLFRYPAHIQQLDMESNGKSIDKEGKKVDFETGPIIWGEPGSNAQHSFFQLLHQGSDIQAIEMIGFKECQDKDAIFQNTTSQQKLLSNLFAQSISLATGKKDENPNKNFSGNRPNHILFTEKLTPYTLGVLLSYFENKVAFQGFIWGINSFDQEGVELGKVLSNKILALFSKSGEYPLGKAYLNESHTYP